MKKAIVVVLVLLVLVTLGARAYYLDGLKAKNPESRDFVEVNIPQGSSGSKIVEILNSNDLLKNEKSFKLYLKLNKVNDLKAGVYQLSSSMDTIKLIEALRLGGKNDKVVKVTIPEGYELREIVKKLNNEMNLSEVRLNQLLEDKANFEEEVPLLKELSDRQSLEGYLYPSTYEFEEEASEEEVILKMLKQFEKIYNEKIREYEGEIQGIPMDLNKIVTLASIIEREGVVAEEKEIISGVFYNRLNTDMRLGSCATVQYILGERKERLSTKDTKIESEYNTYINPGLPPAPISSVSLVSLEAAANPKKTDYLYFRSKEDGSGAHIFSKTYEEHKAADPRKKEV